MFRSLFLYFLSFTGFLCYGDSFSNETATQWISEIPNNYFNGKAMYYVVSGQQWNKLPEEIKTDVFEINPEQARTFFNDSELSKRDMVGHYIGSVNKAQANVISEKVKMLDEIYTIGNIGIEDYDFYREVYNGDVAKALMVNPNRKNLIQEKWVGLGQQNDWGIKKVMYRKNPKTQRVKVLYFDAGVVDSMLAGIVSTKGDIQGLVSMGAEIPYLANTDYIQPAMREKGMEIEISQNLHHFYSVEPLGGGGGGSSLVSIARVQDYAGFAAGTENIQQGEQDLEWIQTSDNSPVMWIVAPSSQVLNNSAFFK